METAYSELPFIFRYEKASRQARKGVMAMAAKPYVIITISAAENIASISLSTVAC